MRNKKKEKGKEEGGREQLRGKERGNDKTVKRKVQVPIHWYHIIKMLQFNSLCKNNFQSAVPTSLNKVM